MAFFFVQALVTLALPADCLPEILRAKWYNTSAGVFVIEFAVSAVEVDYVEVVNLLGQRMYIEQLQREITTCEIQIEKHGKGAYFLNISTEKGS